MVSLEDPKQSDAASATRQSLDWSGPANGNGSSPVAYPDMQLGIEAHSLRWHMGRERWQRDLVRDRKLKRAGWTMLYYCWDDIHLRSDDLRSEILDIRGSLSSEK
jgi:hypothetical protein